MAGKRAIHSPPSESQGPDYAAAAQAYARDVLAGKIQACKWVKLACRRHLEDLGRASPFLYDEAEAAKVCEFAELLPHIEGTWDTPTIKLEPWQIFCLSVIFGWRRKSDGGRRFSKVYFEVARKNAKSTLAAVVSLYCFCYEGEPAPYIFVGATTGAQAQKVFHPARMMATKTHALREAFGLEVWAKSITEPGGGYIQPINSKGSTQDGHNPHLAVLDELHAHKDRALYDVLDSAMGARRNPLMWIITTAGFDTQGVCYEQRSYATKVLEAVLEADHFFAIIYTLDDADASTGAKADDPFDPRVWIKANPNLGVSVTLSSMESAAKEAQAQPGKLGEFQTKRLNVWTSASKGHVNVAKWKACKGPVDLEALRSVPCWAGYDLGSTSDLTSFRMIWWLDGRLKTWGTRYLPEAAVEPRTTRNSVPYARWRNTMFMGYPYLTVTPGDVTDYAWIERDIRWALANFNVQAIGFDSWNSQDLNNRLMADGAPLRQVRQGHASLAGPMKELDRLYLSGLLDHGGDEVLAWCASNVVARRDHNDNLVPSKVNSSEKIDDYAALLNAMAVSLAEKPAARSVYEDRGLVVV
jgi:phage terminase large subunit-like protein